MTTPQDLAAAVRKVMDQTMEWRPIGTLPTSDNVVSILTDGQRRAAGVFKDGKWTGERGKTLQFEPTLWLAFRDD